MYYLGPPFSYLVSEVAFVRGNGHKHQLLCGCQTPAQSEHFNQAFVFLGPTQILCSKFYSFVLFPIETLAPNPKSLYGLTISPPQISFQDYITDKDQDNDFVFQFCVLRRPFKLSWDPWVPQGHQTRIRPSLSCLCSTTPQYSSILLVLHMSSNVEEISQRSQ